MIRKPVGNIIQELKVLVPGKIKWLENRGNVCNAIFTVLVPGKIKWLENYTWDYEVVSDVLVPGKIKWLENKNINSLEQLKF